MDNINFNDDNFIKTDTYKNFIKENPDLGYLNIRAYAASDAIPIANMQIEVSKVIQNKKVIFYEGKTSESGTITKIGLPTPKISSNDMMVPESIEYDIKAIYNDENLLFKIQMFSNILVIQNINVVPNLRKEDTLYGN